jgi:hypothetical protein
MKFKLNKKLGFSLLELAISILIIGLLITGVIKASDIISESKLVAARALSKGSFVNLHPTNLALWYDATAQDSFDNAEIADGDSVPTWKDINPSSNSNHIDVSTIGTDPKYIATATNGLPAVRFTGNASLTKTNVLAGNLTEDGEQITIFLVQEYFSPNHASSSFLWRTATNSVRIGTHAIWSSGFIYFNFGTCCDPAGELHFTPTPPFNDRTNIISYLRTSKDPGNSFGNDFGKIRINGSEIGTSNILTSDVDISLTETFIVGDSLNGNINELIIFKTALKDSEIGSVERYLSKKWGVELQ